MYRRIVFLFFLLVSYLNGYSQTASVQVITTVMPPYSTLLSEYYTGDLPRLSVLLLNKDFNEPFLQVHLRLTIEGQGVKMQSNPYGNYPTIDLSPGAPVTISQSDLAPYFSAQNLQTSTTGSKLQGRLPEGYYSFCFEAIEKLTNRVVGTKQCANAFLTLSDPPFLTLPEKGKAISSTNPLNLLFQWTPRHLGNPNAINTEYEFSLVEIWDNGITPEAAFYTAQPVYTTKLTTPNLYYGPGEPLLITGKTYAWRVKTIVSGSTGEQEPFKNDGYSEIFWFKLQGDCPLVQNAQIVINPKTNKADFTWNTDPSQVGSYHLDYRKKGDSKWNTVDAQTNKTSLSGLKWDTDYEYRMGTRCVITDDFVYGNNQSFHTLKQDTAGCSPSAQPALTNREPIQTLKSTDTIYASGFRMRLTKVSGSNGTFSGEGYLGLFVPTTTTEVSVKARFTNIRVNTDKQLFEGKIISIYDASEGGVANLNNVTNGGTGVGDVKTGGTSITTTVNAVVDPTKTATVTYTVDSKGDTTYNVTLKGIDGKPIVIKTDKLPATIQDKNGNLYAVDKTGKVTTMGSQGASQQQLLAGKGIDELNKLQTEKGTVTFEAHPNQIYDFDAYAKAYDKSILFSLEYEGLLDGKYRVPNKLLITNSADKVYARVSNLGKDINGDSIRFVTGKGVELTARKTATDLYEVNLLSGPAGDAQELYAVYRDNKAAKANTDRTVNNQNFTYSLGKLKIVTYEPLQLKVKLVPIGDAKVDEIAVAKKLNEVYSKVGVSWTVSKEPSYDYSSWDSGDKQLDIKGAGDNNKYSPEMQKLNVAYITDRGVEDKTPYLFVFDKAPANGKADVEGDMLRNRQFGYIFPSTSDKVVAHELGHGVFHLSHTFDDQYKFSKNDLQDNLLSYGAGTELVKLQWDAIHAPGLVIGIFEKEGDGQIINNSYYFRPDGVVFKASGKFKDIVYSGEIESGSAINGVIYAFNDATNNTVYRAFTDGGKFFGYYIDGDRQKSQYKPDQSELETTKFDRKADKNLQVTYLNYDGKCSVTYYSIPYTINSSVDYTWPSVIGTKLATSIVFVKSTAKVLVSYPDLCKKTDMDAEVAKGTQGRKYYDLYNASATTDSDKQYIKRIGNLINELGAPLCEEFNKQVKANKNAENFGVMEALYLSEQLQSVKSSTPFDKQYKALMAYSDAIDKLKSYKFGSSAELITLVNENFVAGGDKFKWFYDAPFRTLTGTRRNELLDLYRSEKTDDISGRKNVSELFEDEDVLVAIICNIKTNDQSKVVIDHLYNQNLLVKIVDGMDDYSYGGGDNMSQVVSALTGYVYANYPVPNRSYDITQFITNKKFIVFNDNVFFDGRSNSEKLIEETSDILITVARRNPFNDDPDVELLVKPYEYVVVRFINSQKFGKVTLEAGKAYKIPGILLYLLYNKDTRNKLITSARLTFDVASCAIGIGELNAAVKAANWGRAVIAGFEIAVDVADISISSVFKETMERDYPVFYSNFQNFVTGYSIIKFSNNLTQLDKSFEYDFNNSYRRIKNILLTEKSRDVISGASKIKNYLDGDEFSGLRAFYSETDQYLATTRAKFNPSIQSELDDELVDAIRNKNLTSDQIAALDANLVKDKNLVTTLNNDPKQVDNYIGVAKVERFFTSIDEFKAAIARGDNVFYVGKHSDISPRPTGVQSHHGVNSIWMDNNYSNYSPDDAPSVYMLNAPNHNATRGEFNRWAAEMRVKQGLTKVDYKKVTKDEILELAKRQFDVAEVPQNVRDEYYRLWNIYVKTLK